MKKLLLIMLASLFMLTSCDIAGDDEDGTTSNNDYAGTWLSTGTYTNDDGDTYNYTYTYVLTDSTFSLSSIKTDPAVSSFTYSGTVSVSGDQLTRVITKLVYGTTTYEGNDLADIIDDRTDVYTYTVTNDVLRFEWYDAEDDTNYYSEYTKQ